MENKVTSNNRVIQFFVILIFAGFVYPLIMTGIFGFNIKLSIIIGAIFGVIGAVLWVVTANIREKRKARKNAPDSNS